MARDGGTTTGIWVGENEDVVERVDDRLAYGDSRSEWIKAAMELRLAVDDALAGADAEFDTDREKRAFVRQALLDALREERDG